jgi:hypothetical protein
MGFQLAFHKAQYGQLIEWIGFQIQVLLDRVQVIIPPDKIEELLELINKYIDGSVISVKELRSFAGKADHIASIILTWKPFVSEIWGALKIIGTPQAGNPPSGCVWTSQVRPALRWMSSFLSPDRNPHLQEGTG